MGYRKTGAALGCALLAVLLTGCGGAGDDPAKTATDAYQQAGSALVDFEVKAAIPVGGGSITGTSHRRTGASPAGDTVFSAEGKQAEMLQIGNVTYLRQDGGAMKSWRKIDDLYREANAPATEANNLSPGVRGPDLSTEAGGVADPLTYLRIASAAEASGGKRAGEDSKTDDGKDATKYDFGCDITPSGKPGPGCSSDLFGTLATPYHGVGSAEVHIWLDDDNRPVKITADIIFGNPQGNQWMTLNPALRTTGFGEAHSFTPPAESDTMSCHRAGTAVECS